MQNKGTKGPWHKSHGLILGPPLYLWNG